MPWDLTDPYSVCQIPVYRPHTNPSPRPRPGADLHSPETGGIVFYPLMSHDGSLLPVHFVTRSERGREEALLRQWLDVCVTDAGCLVTQCQLPRPPLLVAQMVQEWLNYYRRMW